MLLRERTAGRSAHPDAGAGAEGIALAPYTLLILDLMLPGLNGFEVTGQARAYTDVPILFLTAPVTRNLLFWGQIPAGKVIGRHGYPQGHYRRLCCRRVFPPGFRQCTVPSRHGLRTAKPRGRPAETISTRRAQGKAGGQSRGRFLRGQSRGRFLRPVCNSVHRKDRAFSRTGGNDAALAKLLSSPQRSSPPA